MKNHNCTALGITTSQNIHFSDFNFFLEKHNTCFLKIWITSTENIYLTLVKQNICHVLKCTIMHPNQISSLWSVMLRSCIWWTGGFTFTAQRQVFILRLRSRIRSRKKKKKKEMWSRTCLRKPELGAFSSNLASSWVAMERTLFSFCSSLSPTGGALWLDISWRKKSTN